MSDGTIFFGVWQKMLIVISTSTHVYFNVHSLTQWDQWPGGCSGNGHEGDTKSRISIRQMASFDIYKQ